MVVELVVVVAVVVEVEVVAVVVEVEVAVAGGVPFGHHRPPKCPRSYQLLYLMKK